MSKSTGRLSPTANSDGLKAAEFLDEILRPFTPGQVTSEEQALENVRSAISRGLPEIRGCYAKANTAPWSHRLCIVGGGPSLADTYKDLRGCIATANGAVDFLLSKGIKPHAVAVCDAVDWMADLVPAVQGIEYFIASRCHPSLFDKLKDCNVKLWHAGSIDDPTTILQERRKADGQNFFVIWGGSTICLRWVNLGYALGFRGFDCHGMDSSHRQWSHAYPDKKMDRLGARPHDFLIRGYPSNYVFAKQVPQFIEIAKILMSGEQFERCSFDVFGDGLLQHCWRERDQNQVA